MSEQTDRVLARTEARVRRLWEQTFPEEVKR